MALDAHSCSSRQEPIADLNYAWRAAIQRLRAQSFLGPLRTGRHRAIGRTIMLSAKRQPLELERSAFVLAASVIAALFRRVTLLAE
jgi:hypothetical protein